MEMIVLEPIIAPALAAMPHGFFSRLGGVSRGVYDSLNCGLGARDQHDAVSENRRRVCAHLGVAAGPLLTCHQIHSAEALIIEEAWGLDQQPKADALVTRTPGLVIGALAADCMPILFADAEAGVIAAAHAGWKGALGGIETSVVEKMERLGARRQRIHAVIGPCISQSAYEVGPEFHATFLAANAAFGRYFRVPARASYTTSSSEPRPHFDLPGLMLDRLQAAGLASARWIGACTYANPELYFSYRRMTHTGETDYGRHVAAIALPMTPR